jgi:sec-independent protein translocase protein TatC
MSPDLETKMTLGEHLAELRSRIIRSVLAVVLGAIVIVAFYDQVLDVLVEPYRNLCSESDPGFCDGEVFILDPIEGLATRLRVATYGGVILALPVILWQVWRFVVPALNRKERRYAIPFIVSTLVLFALGAVVAYFTLGRALQFLISWSGEDVGQVFQISRYLRLVGVMAAAFGIGFLLPVLLVFLQLVGVIRPHQLVASWRYAILGIAVLAAFITPSGDPVSLAVLAVPMTALYFLAALIGWLLTRRRTAGDTPDSDAGRPGPGNTDISNTDMGNSGDA